MLRIAFLLTGVALFIYLLIELGLGEVLSLLQRVGWDFLIVCLIYVVYVLIRARALFESILHPAGLSYWQVLGIYVSGEAVRNLTFGGSLFSEPFKALLIRRRGLSVDRAVAAALTEFLAHLLISSAIALAGMLLLLRYLKPATPLETVIKIAILSVAAFLVMSLLTGWLRLRLLSGFLRRLHGVPWLPGRLRPDTKRAYEIETALFLVLRGDRSRSLTLAGIELLAQGLLIFELYWILRTLDLTFPLLYPFLVESAAKFIRVAFFFVPLQVGAAEGAFTYLFESMGLLSAAGFTLSLVRRLRSLVVAALGLASGWYLTAGTRNP